LIKQTLLITRRIKLLKVAAAILWILCGNVALNMDISVESVCQFIVDHGGKVKNTILVSHFKKVLNDPATKGKFNLYLQYIRNYFINLH